MCPFQVIEAGEKIFLNEKLTLEALREVESRDQHDQNARLGSGSGTLPCRGLLEKGTDQSWSFGQNANEAMMYHVDTMILFARSLLL